MLCRKRRVALRKDQTAGVFSKKKNGNTIRRYSLRLTLFLFIIFAARVVAVPVTIQYTAHIGPADKVGFSI